MTGEDYEAARPVPARSGVTGDPWVHGHLPECWFVDPTKLPAVAVNDGWPCICDRLRACEARVLSVAGPHNYTRGRKDGYAAGVQAARDAVAAVPHDLTCFRKTVIGCTCTRGEAIAAIDALREKP